ncbi:MAG: adenylyl-sulfate kinase [Bacteroidia bacterium]
MTENLFPSFDKILPRSEKEKLLNQRGMVIWLTGLSGAGKTTIALALEKKLHEKKILTEVLDGDNVRTGINRNLGFSEIDRMENIRRIAEVAKLFLDCGIVTICAFVSPTETMRQEAKKIIGENYFFEVFVNTPFAVCEKRDVKGLYAKVKKGELKNFTGADSSFEMPVNADLIIHTENTTVENCAEQILKNIVRKIIILKK